MAFLLRFVHPDDRRSPGERDIERALELLPGPRTVRNSRSGVGRSHYYHNPDTGVHARFVTYPREEEGEIGLDFEMLQPCPTFFALEALPLAVQMARELRVQTVVVQPGPVSEPFNPNVEILLRYWTDGNYQAVQDMERAPAYCSAESLENAWEFMTLHPEMRRRYGRGGMQVPTIHLLQDKKTEEVFRWTIWRRLESIILPEVDLVQLIDPPEPVPDGRIYRAEELVEACRPFVRDVSQPIFHRLFDRDTAPREMVEAVAGLKGIPMRGFDEIDFDQVTDIKLS